MPVLTSPIDLQRLAEHYAQAAIDACALGAELHQAAQWLREHELERAEESVRMAIDMLARVIEDMPRLEE